MGVVALKIKIMPESIDTDLEVIKKKIEESIMQAGAIRINSIEIEPIAFGLKAIIITLAWPEQEETDKAEQALKVEGVGSVEILDYRRAFG